MAAMEQAAGASNLFDAPADIVNKHAEVHTSLGERATDIIRCYNEREASEKATQAPEPPEPPEPHETTEPQETG